MALWTASGPEPGGCGGEARDQRPDVSPDEGSPAAVGPGDAGDQVGLNKILAKMKAFQATMDDVYQPAALLETMAAEGKRFTAG